jgi:mono/diheme cytochrome c family protein
MRLAQVLAAAIILLFAIHALAADAHAQQGESKRGDAVRGLKIAQSHCSTCHAIGTSVKSRNPQAPPFREFSRHYPVSALEEALAEGILVEHPEMPEFQLSPQQNRDLVEYLRRVQLRWGA